MTPLSFSASFLLTMEVVAGCMCWVARPVNEHLPMMSEWTVKGVSEPTVLEGNGNSNTWNLSTDKAKFKLNPSC